MLKAKVTRWTREHSLIALNLYGKLPFGRLHKGNPLIKAVAERMGRSPGSLAMKLCNFASFDPVLQKRGIRGLPGASKLDGEIWTEYQSQWSELGVQSEELLNQLMNSDDAHEVDLLTDGEVRLNKLPDGGYTGATERCAFVRQRRGQQFFRQTILNAYGCRCCITGINVPQLLVASHIRPWSDFPEDRLKSSNGLCLSSLHDAAFDCGLITLDESCRVVLSSRLRHTILNLF